ncbi:MAG: hypothetical protein AAGB24_01640 [Bacteroidota bacterium]
MSKEEQLQQMVAEELLTIDWNEVDQYPLFEGCNESVSRDLQRNCFEKNMLTHFSSALSDLNYTVKVAMNDTMNVDFLIDEHGFISVLEVEENSMVTDLLPEFRGELTQRLNDLTTVRPAIKRDVHVSMRFRLPIVLNTTK